MVEESIGLRISELTAQHGEGEELADAILDLKVCDPAMGSGHFLVEAVDYLAREVLRVAPAAAGDGGTDSELQFWRRRVVERCVYGVDQNPLAVELAKLSLWLTTVSIERPLSFLDSHLLHGNSLLGTTIENLGTLRRRRPGQEDLFGQELGNVLPRILGELRAITGQVSETLDDVHRKEELLAQARELMKPFKTAAHVWLSSRFGEEVSNDLYGQLLERLNRPRLLAQLVEQQLGQALFLAESQYAFFHWELEFPEVFLTDDDNPGFDVVVTNPPYVNANELNNVLSRRSSHLPAGLMTFTFSSSSCASH
jgi:hypothetical protein